MPAPRTPRVSIVGAGAVGSPLGRALHKRGYPIVSVISRSGRSAISLARAVQCKKASTQIGDLSAETECLLLTVPDAAIGEVAARVSKLKSLNFKKLFVAHCSGVYSAELLEPIRRRGALVASMHPIQTFPSSGNPGRHSAKLRGIYYGIDGEREALKRTERLIEDLEGSPLIIRKELRPLYHLICVIASNYLTVQLNAIDELTKILGVSATWQEMFGPLMTTTMENAVTGPPADSLTGPIVRGDFSTVDLHLKALSTFAPCFLPFYVSGGVEVARVGKERQRISQDSFDGLIRQFRQFLKTHSFNNEEKVEH